jgi:hypothetical protein
LYQAGTLFSTAYPEWAVPLFYSILPGKYLERGHVHITHNLSSVIGIAFNTNYHRKVTCNTSHPLTVAAENVTTEIIAKRATQFLRD